MQKLVPIKFLSLTLLLVLLVTSINGVHDSTHALPSQTTAVGEQASLATDSTHSCPCDSDNQHEDCDGCDTCVNCSCHAPLTMQPFQLRYAPLIITLSSADPFAHLPEVFLPKFVPPQKYA